MSDDGSAPSVDNLGAAPATAAPKIVPKKTTFGAKKPAAKKGGLGAKKGLGASRATKDFADIEKEAELADQVFSSRMSAKVQVARLSCFANDNVSQFLRLTLKNLFHENWIVKI